jgi:hypothetical protein
MGAFVALLLYFFDDLGLPLHSALVKVFENMIPIFHCDVAGAHTARHQRISSIFSHALITELSKLVTKRWWH